MTLKWKALLAVCAAAAMVCLVAATRFVKVRAEREEAQQAEVLRVAREERATREAEARAARAAVEALAPSEVADVSAAVSEPPSPAPEEVQSKATGQLVVQVDEVGSPLADVLVECLNDAGGKLAAGRTDVLGRAAFSGLAVVRCTVRVELPEGGWTSVRAELGPTEVVARVALGPGRLDGRVWDRDGRVAVGVPLVIRQTPQDAGSELVRELRTDHEGWYHCANLALLPTRLEDGDSSIPRVAQAELRDGAPARLDLGQPDGKFQWSGRLVTSGGLWIDEPLELKLVETQRGWSTNILCSADGSFATRLRTGDWVALATGVDGAFEVARVALRDADLEQDAVLGTCVRLVLPETERGRDVSEVAIALQQQDSDDVREWTPRGSRLVIAGIQPGLWHVDARRMGLEFDLDAALEFRANEGELIELTLDVRWAELP